MEIYNFIEYKPFIHQKVLTAPKKGRGIYRQLGIHLGLNSVVISQIFRGKRDLTLEQALAAAEFFNFTQLEQDYFLLMVQYARALNHKLKSVFRSKMHEAQKKSQDMKARLSHTQDVGHEAKSVYYSNWLYSGVRIASSVDGGQRLEQIAEKLGVPASELARILEFLVANGICAKNNELYNTGLAITHLEARSPLVMGHHRNWRIKAMEKMNAPQDDSLFYTLPTALSREDIKAIRKKTVAFIEEVHKVIQPSTCEEVACLNIDWFRFGK